MQDWSRLRYDGFVSASYEDRRAPVFQRLINDLRKRGFNLWTFDSEVIVGSYWAEKISDGIKNSNISFTYFLRTLKKVIL